MFRRSARHYDALYAFKDYRAATDALKATLRSEVPAARSLLDVACGTGKHLELLQDDYEVAGVDLEPEMIHQAQVRCPRAKFLVADMVDFDFRRRFDVVTCLFSSVAYVQTAQRLEQAIATMARHVAPGGLLIVEPWFSPEQYWVGRITANHVDLPNTKITWMYRSERRGTLGVLDIHFMVGTPAGIETFTELHEIGLFTPAEYRGALEKAGLEVRFEPVGYFGRGVYLGRKPAA